MDSLTLETEHGSVQLEPSCLVLFIDDTGEVNFSDKNFPVFGLGGCATTVFSYRKLIRDPWLEMKDKFFEGANSPLHAADLREPSEIQIEALNHFFSNSSFSRFAVVTSDQALFETKLNPSQLVIGCLWHRIEDIAKWIMFDRLAFIFESSTNVNKILKKYFLGYKLQVDSTDIPVKTFIMSKKLNEPGLEVADFIMHTAGAQVRTRMHSKEKKFRRDFKVIFQDVDKKLQSFIEITSATQKK